MDKRIEEYWVEKYPKLFSGYHMTMWETPMARGFTCGNGWFYLLDELWIKLAKFDGLTIGQVKEKLGGLRVYPNPPYIDGLRKLIESAETKALETCEMCGQPGKRRSGNWIFTLCDTCSRLEGPSKWLASEDLGNKIVKELGLRTECKTKEDHISDFNYKKCIVCGAKRTRGEWEK